MANRKVAVQGAKCVLVKDLGDETCVAQREDVASEVSGGNASCLLATVLKGVKGQVRVLGDFETGGDNSKDATLVPRSFTGVSWG